MNKEFTIKEKKDLLLFFSPMVYLAKDEKYFPSSVEKYFSNAKRIKNTDNSTNPPYYYLSNPEWTTFNFPDYLYGSDPKKDLPPAYAYFIMKENSMRFVYFFFFPFNNAPYTPLYDHTGDWEHIAIDLKCSPNGVITPIQVHFEAHGNPKIVPWNKVTIITSTQYPMNNHPIVYCASGTHGTWPSEGKHYDVPSHIFPDECSKGKLWYTNVVGHLRCFDVDISGPTIKGMEITHPVSCPNKEWPTWMTTDYSNPNSEAVKYWGDINQYIAHDGPTGPIEKGLFCVSND